ncbi:temperature dependent protein affecting M2 dsRNA replication-domain-containing protein [Absidia repens]|uniref:Temperature dependent protein affecting M2 dsRNA replication-domain-containing protein n=1 Tax=Absidia repens TaxID=90262 RepID=A0A1X2I5T7_9FUNG|nr:temperature dependent protein affecting M2 dsRNA replication-domain-containing protein [Absidia repens]
MMRGLVGPQVINNLVSGVLIENAPLDNGETTEYRNFLLQLLSIRTQTLSLLTQPLHQFFQLRKVACYFWFDPSTEQIMYHRPGQGGTESQNNANFLNNVYEKTSTWNVANGITKTEMQEQQTDQINIAFCIKATCTDAKAAKTIAPSNTDKIIEDKDAIVANVLWKTLEIRDFLTSSKHVYTTWGRALSISLSTLKNPTSNEQEAFLTAFELIRFGVLTANPYSKTYGKPVGDDKQHRHITLFARTMSLLPMEFKVSRRWALSGFIIIHVHFIPFLELSLVRSF